MEIKNKLAVVTGASRGIVAATAILLAEEGAHNPGCTFGRGSFASG